MRERRLSPGQLPVERKEPGPENLKLTKIEVARRELASAISIFFARGDPVSIHVLVSAASEILERLNQAEGRRTFKDELLIHVKDEYKSQWDDMANEAYNFMKHARRDSNELYEYFNPSINNILLVGAVFSYWQLSKPTNIMFLYLSWHMTFEPGIIIPGNEVLALMAKSKSDWPSEQTAALAHAHEVIDRMKWDRP